VDKFGQLIKAAASSNASSHSGQLAAAAQQLTAGQLKECEKQQTLWQKRLSTLKRLRAGLESAGRPHAPACAEVEVTSATSVKLILREPEALSQRGGLYTKVRVQWSRAADFSQNEGERDISADVGSGDGRMEVNVLALVEGQRYFFRAAFGNPKGFGPFSASTPKSIVASCWQSASSGPKPNMAVAIDELASIGRSVMARLSGPDEDVKSQNQKLLTNKKGRGLRHFFSASTSPKFHRGPLLADKLYLSCVLFHEDRVLMTSEDSLPIVAVGDAPPSAQQASADLLWLCKLSRAWPDVERLREEMAKADAASTASKGRLLQSASAMQQALVTIDLGTPFYKPLSHSAGSVVFSLVRRLPSGQPPPPELTNLGLKWTPLARAQRRVSFDGVVLAADALRYSLREQILFHQVSAIVPARGLYLLYLQAASSVDSMRLAVAAAAPSLPPYVRVRDCQHVTAEEWSWMRSLAGNGGGSDLGSAALAPRPTTNFLAAEAEDEAAAAGLNNGSSRPTEAQYSFGAQLMKAADKLFEYLRVPNSQRGGHRLCDAEVLELAPGVAALILAPAPDAVCSVANSGDHFVLDAGKREDLLALTLQTFEAVHSATYWQGAWDALCRASLKAEVRMAAARQAQREALSAADSDEAGLAVREATTAREALENAWRPCRWVLDALTRARSKEVSARGLLCEDLQAWLERTERPDDSRLAHSGRPHFDVTSNKENEVRNFPLMATTSPPASSLSSPKSSLSSVGELTQPAYENAGQNEEESGRRRSSFDPRVAQAGRFSREPAPQQQQDAEPNVLRVFAAYDTGLAAGTSVRLNVGRGTTAKEVAELVVRQLNMAALLQGKEGPVYADLAAFCLVAVIGQRGRCLRDDFRPLDLQNPWRRGRLFVRRRGDVLAAIESAASGRSQSAAASAASATTTIL